MKKVFESRSKLIHEIFPSGITGLWCPLLTHYKDDKSIDPDRMSAHLGHIVPWVRGFLVPGSTGDGWELSDVETLKVVEFAVKESRTHELFLLLGVLKPDAESMKKTIGDMLNLLRQMTGIDDAGQCLRAAGVCGLTACPPGGSMRSQAEIFESFAGILDMGLPVALYQLPQVTENEITPETFQRLVEKYPNLIFFKDTSGNDRIAQSGIDTGGIYLTRGAEKDYAGWLKGAGGLYDGFLLASANSFPKQLSSLIGYVRGGDLPSAKMISDKLSSIQNDMFTLVQSIPWGNQFTNVNKAIDHYNAFGPSAYLKEAPMLHAGVRMPGYVIPATGEILKRHDLMPQKGYMD